MTRLVFLIQTATLIEDDNYLRLAHSAASSGHIVHIAPIDSLRLEHGQITAHCWSFSSDITAGISTPVGSQIPLDHDFVWILSLGERSSFLDKIQLLYAIPKASHIVNSLDVLMHFNSKYLHATRPDLFQYPESFAAPDAKYLASVIREKGGRWIVKPPAGSLGRDVFLLESTDSNLNAILEHLCGPENNHYTLVQKYVAEIEQGEKRVLLAGGEVIGQYQRIAKHDHRSNLKQGAEAKACDLTQEESKYCQQLAVSLNTQGAYFVGIDLAYPWLIETNVVNPGGLVTISDLTGTDLSDRVSSAILSSPM